MRQSGNLKAMYHWVVLVAALALVVTGCGLVHVQIGRTSGSSAAHPPLATVSPQDLTSPPVTVPVPPTPSSTSSSVESSPGTLGSDWASIVAEVRSGVVRLEVVGCKNAGSGSGFLIAPNLIVTAGHVARDASTISAKTDRGIVRAEVIAYNMHADTALLRTQSPLPGYNFTIADRAPVLGEDIGVLGYPLGVSGLRVDPGIVSGGDTSVTYGGSDGFTLDDAIVTDAAINPGNSGGPAINRQGQVVGLVSGSRTWVGQVVNNKPLKPGDAAAAQGTNYLVPSTTLTSKVAEWKDQSTPKIDDCGRPSDAPTSSDFELDVTIEAQSPDASDIALALYTHGDSINQGHYHAAWAVFTPRLQAYFGEDVEGWARSLQSSSWTTLVVRKVSRQGTNAIAHVTLRTKQSPQFGYKHQDCSIYHMVYRLQLTQGGWLIDHADPGSGPKAC